MKTKAKKALLKIAAAANLLAVPAAALFTHSGADLPITVPVAVAGCIASAWCASRARRIGEEEVWEANRAQIHPVEPQGRE